MKKIRVPYDPQQNLLVKLLRQHNQNEMADQIAELIQQRRGQFRVPDPDQAQLILEMSQRKSRRKERFAQYKASLKQNGRE